MGRGPGEYLFLGPFLYDEKTDELFVIEGSHSHADFILVYSSTGTFKRKISLPGGCMSKMVFFDEHSLLIYDQNYSSWKTNDSPPPSNTPGMLPYRPFYAETKYDSPYLLISKTDGAIMDIIKLPEKDYLLKDTKGMSFVGAVSSVIHCPAGVFYAIQTTTITSL